MFQAVSTIETFQWKDGVDKDGCWGCGGVGQAVSTMETFRWKDGVYEDGGGGGGVGQSVSTLETFLKVSVAGVDR